MTLLTPLGGLAALAAVAPAAALIAGRIRTRGVRETLGLPPPRGRGIGGPAAAVAGVVLLGLSAAQPALTRSSSVRIRRDAQALFVVDTSRSMAASSAAAAPTRLDRAVAAAVTLRDAIPSVESGIATLTDRVLPDLLPVADSGAFAGVARGAVGIEEPPPRGASLRATSFGALAQVATGGYFPRSVTRRIVVLLTDGESGSFDGDAVARALASTRGYRFVAVRFWQPGEAVYGAGGLPEAAYRPDPSGGRRLASLATALGGRSFDASNLSAAAAYLRDLAGAGATVHVAGAARSPHSLAPAVALAGVLALLGSVLPLRRLTSRIRFRR